jgi:PhzF family phenazine biosynthesis protein
MSIATFIVDTFTSAMFQGNPTGVCLLGKDLERHVLLALANELNAPVTAFVRRKHTRTDEFDIRYFTPVTEIPACGHATLAAATILRTEGIAQAATFHTIQSTVIKTDAADDLILMHYPKYPLQDCKVDNKILESLSITSYRTAGYSDALETLFIEVDTPQSLRAIQPDFKALVKSSDHIKEVVITSASDGEKYDYLLRSFCPWIGIDEDPVTGSVHGVLGTFWKQRLKKSRLKAYQASVRGGEVMVSVLDDTIAIGGHAVIVLTGSIRITLE